MNWPAMVAAALALWAWVFPGPISVVNGDLEPAYRTVSDQAWADRWSVPGECTITVFPSRMAGWPEHTIQNVVSHEVAHCAGVEHDSQHEGIMYPDASQYEFSGWDRINFWRVHPAPFRLAIGGIAAD